MSGLSEPRPVAAEPAPPSQRDAVQAKTRFLNFRVSGASRQTTRMQRTPAPARGEALATLTIVDGPGEGSVFEMRAQFIQIGRDNRQDVQLDFGDTSISRSCHASIANYGEDGVFTVRDGLKPNPVLVNGKTLRGEGPLSHGDLILIGETTLRFTCA